jgi:hypothetical protein
MQQAITLEILGAVVAMMCGIGGIVYMIRTKDLERFSSIEQKLNDFKLIVSQEYASSTALLRSEAAVTKAVNELRVELRGDIKDMRDAFIDAVATFKR